MSTPNTSLVKWVMPTYLHKHVEGCGGAQCTPVIPLADLTALVEVVMKERCYSNTVYNGALDDLMAQLEAHRKEG